MSDNTILSQETTPSMETIRSQDKIRSMVDEIAKWSKLAQECKQELERLKGEFQKLGADALSDKKLKQIEFWGTGNAKVVVTLSETVKVVSHTFLMQTLDYLLKDFAKEKVTYEYTEPFKRILAAICQGSYVEEQSLDDVISQITDDEKTRKALRKKLKGNWDKDIQTLMNLSGLSREDAEHYAYFIQEILNYEKIVHLLEAAGHHKGTQDFDIALKAIEHAVIVEEGVKVGIEAEEVV